MIKIDQDNSIKIKVEDNKAKLVLYLKKGYNKNIQIEITLDENSIEEVIAKLICAKAKLER